MDRIGGINMWKRMHFAALALALCLLAALLLAGGRHWARYRERGLWRNGILMGMRRIIKINYSCLYAGSL